MKNQKVTFDLGLTNKIFKMNLNSLVESSKFNLNEIKKQNEEFYINLKDQSPKEDLMEISSHLANIDWILLNSIFVSSFSFFEHQLFALARIVEDNNSSKISINDINGKGVVKFCNYLFLVGNIESANRSKNKWNEINLYQKVRNMIVHNGAIMIDDLNKNIKNHECYNFLKEQNVTMAGEIGHIRIRQINFIANFNIIASKISDAITDEILEKYKINNCC